MYDEITPVVSRDGTKLYYTKVGDPGFVKTLFLAGMDFSAYSGVSYDAQLSGVFSEIAGQVITDPATSVFNQDVWLADLELGGGVSKIEHPDYPLNSALPNSIVSITPDPNAFVVINQFDDKGMMQKGFSIVRRQSSGSWSNPEAMNIEGFYTLTSEVSLTMSFDGQILILSAMRKGAQDMDLYMCRKKEDGSWSSPKHLGNTINSPDRETTPYLSEDNETLFFSSNRFSAKGGNDIFMSKRLDETWQKWSVPQRLSAPVNSGADDSQPYFNMTTGYIYFTSKRDGNSDIYRVKIAPPQPTEITLKGRVINGQTGQVVSASVRYGARDGRSNIIQAEEGTYSLSIPKGVAFDLLPEKPGFTGQTEDIFFPKEFRFFQDTYIVDLIVNPLAVNALIELRPIYFQQSKAIILEKSFEELDKLALLLQESPNLQIRVEGHTDNLGKKEDLLHLSKERADALKDFLVKKGIEAERIKTVGYGAEFPLNKNASDEERSKNRRVEIRIIKV